MAKKIILVIFLIGLTITAIVILNPAARKTSLTDPLIPQPKSAEKARPSETFLQYSDPSGFSFSYPDNLSITKNDIEDNSTYVDLQLSSKDVSGNLSLKIIDSKFTSLDDWLKSNKITSKNTKEVKLGNLKALEVQLEDRLLLGALDQGILFNIEMPAIETDFWLPIYNKILENFSFVVPENTTSQGPGSSSEDVIFEGEEVVE